MSDEGRDHAEYLWGKIAEEGKAKYMGGQKAHGGSLPRKACLPHAIEEALDLPTYLFTLQDQHAEVIEHLDLALYEMDQEDGQGGFDPQFPLYRHVLAARNILLVGNPEGVEEEEKDD